MDTTPSRYSQGNLQRTPKVRCRTDSVKPKRETSHKLHEFRLNTNELEQVDTGKEITVDYFEKGELVDVTGNSIGKGYAGVIKRHNFKTQDATHGNSLAHRAPGSIGQNQTPGVFSKAKDGW